MYRKALVAAALLFVLSVTLGACNVPKGETENLTEEMAKITFASGRSGNYDIYLMDTDGSNRTRLTTNQAHDELPSWSPIATP